MTSNPIDPIQFAGDEPTDFGNFVDSPSSEDYPFSRLELALDTYRVYRIAGHSRIESARHFIKVLRGTK